MKQIIITLVYIFFSITTFSQNVNVKEIVRKIDANETVSSSISKSRLTIETSSGKIRVLEMTGYSKDNNDKQLSIYTSPKRVKGDKILMLNDGDDIWFYTPKTDRVRHLASHAKKKKVQGSDFSYEDMGSGNYEEDYTSKLLGVEEHANKQCYKIEMIPTESGPHYSKLIFWADINKFITYKIDYYEDNEPFKSLIISDYEFISNKWVGKKLVMTNLQDGGKTIMETLEIKIGVKVKSKLFTTNSLKRN